MKLWRHIFFTTISFFAIAGTMTYTSCVEDPCYELKCQNGGSCANGVCNCPSGWEGGNCEIPAVHKFLGIYYGYTKVNEKPVVVDSASVTTYGHNGIRVFAYTEMDSIAGVINIQQGDLAQFNTQPLSQGSFGTTSITIEKNKLVFYVEKFVNGQKYVYTFTGNK